jgi:hypothetical protein
VVRDDASLDLAHLDEEGVDDVEIARADRTTSSRTSGSGGRTVAGTRLWRVCPFVQ